MIEILRAMFRDSRIPHRLGARYTDASAINASGYIVGTYGTDSGNNGFLYSGSTCTTLDVTGNGTTEARGINASGQIVGSYYESTPTGFKTHGFLYVNGLYATIDHPSTRDWTVAQGINALGHIVGAYNPASGGGGGKAFVYINGLYAPVNYPSARQTLALGINDRSQIVGAYVDSSGHKHGYLFSYGAYSTINYPLATDTFAMGINAGGQIVGMYDAGLNLSTPGNTASSTTLTATLTLRDGHASWSRRRSFI